MITNTTQRAAVIFALMIFLSGCGAGYRTVYVQSTNTNNKQIDLGTRLKIGSSIRVTSTSGMESSGVLIQITETSITLGVPQQLNMIESVILIKNIASIAREVESGTATAIVGTVGALSALSLIAIILAVSMIGPVGLR